MCCHKCYSLALQNPGVSVNQNRVQMWRSSARQTFHQQGSAVLSESLPRAQMREEDLESIGFLERLLRCSHEEAHLQIADILWSSTSDAGVQLSSAFISM